MYTLIEWMILHEDVKLADAKDAANFIKNTFSRLGNGNVSIQANSWGANVAIQTEIFVKDFNQWLRWIMQKIRANGIDIGSVEQHGNTLFIDIIGKNKQADLPWWDKGNDYSYDSDKEYTGAKVRYGYHVLPTEFVPLVQEKGLIPADSKRSKSSWDKYHNLGKIFFTDSLPTAEEWQDKIATGRSDDRPYSVVIFDLDKAGIKASSIQADPLGRNGFTLKNRIPPSAFVEIIPVKKARAKHTGKEEEDEIVIPDLQVQYGKVYRRFKNKLADGVNALVGYLKYAPDVAKKIAGSAGRMIDLAFPEYSDVMESKDFKGKLNKFLSFLQTDAGNIFNVMSSSKDDYLKKVIKDTPKIVVIDCMFKLLNLVIPVIEDAIASLPPATPESQ